MGTLQLMKTKNEKTPDNLLLVKHNLNWTVGISTMMVDRHIMQAQNYDNSSPRSMLDKKSCFPTEDTRALQL